MDIGFGSLIDWQNIIQMRSEDCTSIWFWLNRSKWLSWQSWKFYSSLSAFFYLKFGRVCCRNIQLIIVISSWVLLSQGFTDQLTFQNIWMIGWPHFKWWDYSIMESYSENISCLHLPLYVCIPTFFPFYLGECCCWFNQLPVYNASASLSIN